MKRIRNLIAAVGCAALAAAFAVVLVARGDTFAQGIRQGLELCLQTVIPSLFCFMILTCFLMQSGLYRVLSLPLGPACRWLLYLPGEMSSVVLLSLIGGYPMGAQAIAGLVRQNRLARDEAQRMLAFCCCTAPSFAVTAVGGGMFGNSRAGLLLYGIQLGVSLGMGAALGLHARFKKRLPALSSSVPCVWVSPSCLGESFVAAVGSSVSAMAQMCGFILLFAALQQAVQQSAGSSAMGCLLLGLCEVTNGCRLAAGIPCGLVYASLFLSFGGLSVIAQIAGILRGTGLRMLPFAAARIVHAVLSVAAAFLLLPLLPEAAAVFANGAQPVPIGDANTPVLSICLMMMSALFLLQLPHLRKKG